MTNGGGVGIIATDLLMDEEGELAALQPKTIAALDKQMPRIWSRANPVDIVGDADGARYSAAVDALADDRGVGAVLVMNVPTALTSPVEVAHAVAGAPGAKVAPLIGCWIGGPDAQDGRKVLHEAGRTLERCTRVNRACSKRWPRLACSVPQRHWRAGSSGRPRRRCSPGCCTSEAGSCCG